MTEATHDVVVDSIDRFLAEVPVLIVQTHSQPERSLDECLALLLWELSHSMEQEGHMID